MKKKNSPLHPLIKKKKKKKKKRKTFFLSATLFRKNQIIMKPERKHSEESWGQVFE